MIITSSLEEAIQELENIIGLNPNKECLWGAPQTIFISATDGRFLVGGSGQNFATDWGYEKCFGKQVRTMRYQLSTQRKGLLAKMLGMDALRKSQQNVLRISNVTPRFEFTNNQNLQTCVKEAASRALHRDAPGQAYGPHPAFKPRCPCAKCRAVHQFKSIHAEQKEMCLKFHQVPSCGEDAWHLKSVSLAQDKANRIFGNIIVIGIGIGRVFTTAVGVGFVASVAIAAYYVYSPLVQLYKKITC